MSDRQSVAVIFEGDHAPSDVTRLIGQTFRLVPLRVQQFLATEMVDAAILVIDLGSLDQGVIQLLSEHLAATRGLHQSVVLITNRSQIRQLAEIGILLGNNAVSRPIGTDNFLDLIESLLAMQRVRAARAVERRRDPVDDPLNVVQSASVVAQSLDQVFALSRDPTAVAQADLGPITTTLSEAIQHNGLNGWVNSVRQHHSGTYQHCLLVAGTTVAFGQHFGFSRADMHRITTAALVHDLGKISIPLEILDKPGKLTAEEMDIIKSHTVIGHDILRSVQGFDAEMLDMVLSHHEYLDGSGYPNGRTAQNISDLVRVITMSDVFSALIEARSYKPAISGRDAYEIMLTMSGKLDMPLVKAQRQTMLAV